MAKLSQFMDELSWNEAEALFEAAQLNSQVKWIGTDSDVAEFYKPLIEKFAEKLGLEKAELLKSIFVEQAVEVDDWGEDPPF